MREYKITKMPSPNGSCGFCVSVKLTINTTNNPCVCLKSFPSMAEAENFISTNPTTADRD